MSMIGACRADNNDARDFQRALAGNPEESEPAMEYQGLGLLVANGKLMTHGVVQWLNCPLVMIERKFYNFRPVKFKHELVTTL